ncbi:MAG TPA: ABC transporter substrate-binding protein [Thermoanaerobaculia bacterium]|nr:ABC transporter substrate-binding protein [Thermoanaerobaculia bacterium]
MKRLLVALSAALLFATATAAAPPPDLRQAGLNYFSDVELVDQNGAKVRFYSDLLAGKVVVINSFFATCSGSCPVMSGTFRKIQTALGDRVGRDVHLVSITVDPETDTPAQLRKFAKAASAGPGWHLVTGSKENVSQALRKLGLLTETKETHTAVVLIGNEPKGVWKKAFGLADSDEIVRLVQEVAEETPAAAASLTESEKRGRNIYRHGESPSGREITAIVGQGDAAEVPAGALACGNCHGVEGRGVPEGSIEPADIRAASLATYLVDRGRRRPRYDDALLARALRQGRDSGDRPLSPVMPRYRMDDRDLADLLAYLRRLGGEPQPGLADDELTVATVLPLSTPAGDLTRQVIEGYFADVNAAGGVHGRTLKLRAIDAAANPAEALAGDVFAVVCATAAANDVQALIDEERIPLVTPLSSGTRPAPSSFSIFPDLVSQTLALAKHAGAGPRDVYILHDRSEAARAAAAAVEERAGSLQWTVRAQLRPEKSGDDLLFLIGVDPADAVRRLDAAQWRPRILIAGAPLPDLPPYANEIAAALPTLPADLTTEGLRELHAFTERHGLPCAHPATQVAAHSAAKVFVEALKRAGRDLTREKLIATLETTFYQFPTGLTPPVTYARNRHIGASGAFIVTLDREKNAFVQQGSWVGSDL